MTRFILVALATILIGQCVNSQNFISENKQWNVKEGFWGDIRTEVFKIEGDTIINAVTYQKVWQCSDSAMVHWWLLSFIREDADIVYILDINDNEHVMYNFNLSTGDTAVTASYFCDDMETIIYNVDTVNYLGIDRKRWALDDEGFEYWLEGIGSNFGLMYSRYYQCIFDVEFSLLCYYEGDTLEYIKEGEDECFQTSVGVDESAVSSQRSAVNFYPNPSTKSVTIKLSNFDRPYKNTTLTISNIKGQEIIQRQLTENQTLVDVSGLASGVYVVRVVSDEDVRMGRFVKQ